MLRRILCAIKGHALYYGHSYGILDYTPRSRKAEHRRVHSYTCNRCNAFVYDITMTDVQDMAVHEAMTVERQTLLGNTVL